MAKLIYQCVPFEYKVATVSSQHNKFIKFKCLYVSAAIITIRYPLPFWCCIVVKYNSNSYLVYYGQQQWYHCSLTSWFTSLGKSSPSDLWVTPLLAPLITNGIFNLGSRFGWIAYFSTLSAALVNCDCLQCRPMHHYCSSVLGYEIVYSKVIYYYYYKAYDYDAVIVCFSSSSTNLPK